MEASDISPSGGGTAPEPSRGMAEEGSSWRALKPSANSCSKAWRLSPARAGASRSSISRRSFDRPERAGLAAGARPAGAGGRLAARGGLGLADRQDGADGGDQAALVERQAQVVVGVGLEVAVLLEHVLADVRGVHDERDPLGVLVAPQAVAHREAGGQRQLGAQKDDVRRGLTRDVDSLGPVLRDRELEAVGGQDVLEGCRGLAVRVDDQR
nr:hypothetical protein [Nannocystis exedens]